MMNMNVETPKMTESPEWSKLPSISIGRLLLLGLMSVLLCMAFPLAVFAPVPLVMAFILFGRVKTWGLAFLLTTGLGVLTLLLKGNAFGQFSLETGVLFVSSLAYAVAISEIIFRKMDPSTGVIKMGTLLLCLTLLVGGTYSVLTKTSPLKSTEKLISEVLSKVKEENKELLSSEGEEARELQSYLEKPELIARWVPAAFFVSVFFGLWVGLFIVLRNSIVWAQKYDYPFRLKDLLRFKASESMVWPLIVGLVLYLGSDYGLGGEKMETIGGNILYCVSVFYFFQGMGVFLDFLDYLRLYGFIRAFFVFGTLLMAWKYLVVVGIFDYWVNFRRFFVGPQDRSKDTSGDGPPSF